MKHDQIRAVPSGEAVERVAPANETIKPSSITDTLLVPRRDQIEPMFGEGGGLCVNLNGYAIIPMEEFHALNGAKGFAPEDHWPCAACHAEGPTSGGHDPCIANLPGVIHACCGHGYGHAYVMFSNGAVLRGHFEGGGQIYPEALSAHAALSASKPDDASALLKAAVDLRDDLLNRAEWDGDAKVVVAGAGAWFRFNEAIDASIGRDGA